MLSGLCCLYAYPACDVHLALREGDVYRVLACVLALTVRGFVDVQLEQQQCFPPLLVHRHVEAGRPQLQPPGHTYCWLLSAPAWPKSPRSLPEEPRCPGTSLLRCLRHLAEC